ncbi:SpaH/EbpB family LPXTG-anchored major pilin [Corynebacterium lactis]|uniref:Type-2 fimbrial major subunit n=1 Tax=Corynebacterium lactis RW2-5 TaxID=1408189 RepID=A0A0K2GXW8_9CORY|nr:SpaH/EbpB family LPXTG-anchored major pilin [Corynebacterium lactis]ALA66523.1 type-2 fimbrial major subunit [Corynebacterium lactis RW2-5]
MNKFSRTARSVTFAAIVGLSLGISAPGAFAQDAVEAQTGNVALANAASLINKDQKATLTIHKFGDPTELGERTGEAKDREKAGNGTALNEVGFTIYKVLKTADGKTAINLNTNEGLAAAAGIKAGDYAKFVDAKGNVTEAGKEIIEKKGEEQKTANAEGKDGVTTFEIGTDHAPYLVVETSPKEGYTPANPFIAFVPMTKANAGENQGTEWNYDVHAVPKNYKKTPPQKTVTDQDENGKLAQAGDVVKYDISTTVRNIEAGKRLKYYYISDTLDAKNFDVMAETTKFAVSIDGESAAEGDYTVSKDRGSNAFRINFTVDGLKKLKSGSKVNVHVEAVKNSSEKVAPNQAIEWEPSSPSSDQDVDSDTPPEEPQPGDGRRTEVVQSRFGELKFTKVDAKGEALEGAEFKIYQTKRGGRCEDYSKLDLDKHAFEVKAQDANIDGGKGEQESVFKSTKEGGVHVTGLHVNDFVNNAPATDSSIDGTMTEYCLIETKAPKGKELLSKAVAFRLVASAETTKVEVPKEVTTWEVQPDGTVTNVKTAEETTTIDVPVYKPVTVTVGDKGEGKVVNIDDTTPQLPLTGGAGVGILAAIGAAIVAAGAWFARRGAKN